MTKVAVDDDMVVWFFSFCCYFVNMENIMAQEPSSLSTRPSSLKWGLVWITLVHGVNRMSGILPPPLPVRCQPRLLKLPSWGLIKQHRKWEYVSVVSGKFDLKGIFIVSGMYEEIRTERTFSSPIRRFLFYFET